MRTSLPMIAGLLLVAGCQTVNTTERAAARAKPNPVDEKRVVTDPSLGRAARLAGVREATTEGGLLKVQVAIRNDTTSRKRVNYRFEWFDAEGMRLDTQLSSWRPATLQGKETIWLTAVAPTPAAEDFQLKLVEAG